MAKKNFKIRVKFVFSGSVIVSAHDRKEAEAAAEKHIAAHLGKVEPLEEDIQDWDINLKGTTVVNRQEEKGAEL